MRMLFPPGKPWRDKATRAAIAKMAQRLRDEIEEERYDRMRNSRIFKHRQDSEEHRTGYR